MIYMNTMQFYEKVTVQNENFRKSSIRFALYKQIRNSVIVIPFLTLCSLKLYLIIKIRYRTGT